MISQCKEVHTDRVMKSTSTLVLFEHSVGMLQEQERNSQTLLIGNKEFVAVI